MKKILLHNGNNNIIKAINKFLVKNLDTDKTQILFNSWHNQLCAVYQTHKPDIVFWCASEYSQEFQDFVTEYHSQVTIFLIVDVEIGQEALNNFLNTIDNIKIIKNAKFKTHYRNTIAEYDSLYDADIFFNQQLTRNDKTVVLLSPDNDRNHALLDTVLYPNNKHPIVVVNNPNFDSVVNLGLINYNDLAFIMNTYSNIIDLDNLFPLEASACEINSIDISNNDINDALDNHKIYPRISDLGDHTYEVFVQQKILPHIGLQK
jgi:hypothetical protein